MFLAPWTHLLDNYVRCQRLRHELPEDSEGQGQTHSPESDHHHSREAEDLRRKPAGMDLVVACNDVALLTVVRSQSPAVRAIADRVECVGWRFAHFPGRVGHAGAMPGAASAQPVVELLLMVLLPVIWDHVQRAEHRLGHLLGGGCSLVEREAARGARRAAPPPRGPRLAGATGGGGPLPAGVELVETLLEARQGPRWPTR
mmetsp:Transcript_146443/g.380702  ORF Transcript_146443/g.380702 Transcript_146443/m.380702 type:complete len:201 (+) Transcript_146443:579-1181(+)